MTVGRDAVERTTRPPKNRRFPTKGVPVFLLGIGVGILGAIVAGSVVNMVSAFYVSFGEGEPSDKISALVRGPSDRSTTSSAAESGSHTIGDDSPSSHDSADKEVARVSDMPTQDSLPVSVEPPMDVGPLLPKGPADVSSEHFLLEGDGPASPDIVVVEGKIRPNQFLVTMLVSAGLSDAEAGRAVRSLAEHFDPTKSRPGDRYRVDVVNKGELGRFEYQPAPDQVYLVARDIDGAFHSQKLNIKVEREVVTVDGEIKHSLWLAFEESGESPALAAYLTEAFRFDIDFFHDTRKGDKFRFFVEKYTHQGELIRYGQIYAAEYIGAKNSPIGSKRLYWYENAAKKIKGFYDKTGKAAQRAFLRSPLKYTRISSDYGFRRHPILGKRHFHGGIDYAAPTGTPVRSVASGTVVFAAKAGPNGNLVRVKHAGGYESFYLHLSKILVRRNAKVGQSTIIGKVGSTGRSTGPHLDFRLKRNGKYLNPRKTVAPRTKSIPKNEYQRFQNKIAPWVKRLSQAAESDSELATN